MNVINTGILTGILEALIEHADWFFSEGIVSLFIFKIKDPTAKAKLKTVFPFSILYEKKNKNKPSNPFLVFQFCNIDSPGYFYDVLAENVFIKPIR